MTINIVTEACSYFAIYQLSEITGLGYVFTHELLFILLSEGDCSSKTSMRYRFVELKCMKKGSLLCLL